MKALKNLQLAGTVIWDGINNNKALLLSGCAISTGIGVAKMGKPNFNLSNIHHCFTAISPCLPYIKSAMAGIVVVGLGKVLINALLQEMEDKDKETPRI